MKTRVSAYALIVNDDKILLTQLADKCYRAGHWSLPGGGMDHGELPEQTVIRECKEETNLTVRDLEIFHAYAYSESERGLFMGVQIVYRAQGQGEPKVMEIGGSTADAKWFSLKDVPGLPTVPMLDVILERLSAITRT